MKPVARLGFIAVLFAALCLPIMAAERDHDTPIFYQAYNVRNCTAQASGVGKVTATFLYYWDIAAQENRVANIMHVSYDLAQGFYGSARRTPQSVTVEIRASPGVYVAGNTCKV